MVKFIIVLIFFSAQLWSQTIQISLNNNDVIVPASDLMFQGKSISRDEAMTLKRKGIDLANLNPKISDFYLGKTLPIKNINNYPLAHNPKVQFDGFKKSPTEIFRSFIINQEDGRRYTLSASLDVHAVIARASLMRKLGYDVDIPKYYPKVTINFKTIEEKQDFLLELSDKTLTARARWVSSEQDLSLELKSIVLEPAEIKTLNIYWGVMDQKRQETRRTFRSLLIPFMLTYYPELVNDISWEQGRIFSNYLYLTHPYAEEFSELTIDDLKWILNKTLKLTRNDWEEIFQETNYPEDIKELIIEKTISRMNALAQRVEVDSDVLKRAPKANELLTINNIINGKLTRAPKNTDDYALNFYEQDPLSPYRLAELLRYFGSKIAYSGLSYLIRKAQEEYVPIDPKDALRQLDEMAYDGKDVKREFVSAPYINGRFRAGRRIVFGQFQGSDAPIQIVDNFAIEANLGLLTRHSNDRRVNPVFNLGGTVTRQFLHIKAMPDIQTATKQKLLNVYIPRTLNKLSKKIKEVECDISELPYHEETEINQETFYQIKYDENLENGFNLALEYKKKLISDGYDPNKIIILKINRSELCQEQIKTGTNDLITKFLESFSQDETFVVTDEIRFSLGANSVFSLDYPARIGVRASGRVSKAFGRTFIIRKKDNGFEVVFHNQNVLAKEFGYGLNYIISFFSHDFRKSKYKIGSDVYFLDLKEGDLNQKLTALMTLKSLFSSRSEEIIDENYDPINVDHNLVTDHRVLRFLLWTKDRFVMNHDIKIGIEDDNGKKYNRSFYSFIKAKRRGKDFFEFGKQILSDLVSASLADAVLPPPPVDPGQSVAGNSFRYIILSEIETTKNYEENMVTHIQWGYKGSGAKKKRLFKFFNDLENIVKPFSKKVIDRGPFLQMHTLRTYDILANLILYPKAHEIIEDLINPSLAKSNINKIITLYGEEEYFKACPRARVDNEVCIPRKLEKLYRIFDSLKELKSHKKAKEKLSRAIYFLFDKFDPAKVLQIIGPENFFYTIKVAGFRTNNANGYINYVSDSVGAYDQKLGTGLIDYISKKLKVTSFEVKGLRFAPGLQ